MGKRKAIEADEGDPVLIDVEPENKKNLLRAARTYRKAKAARVEATAEEVKWKKKLLDEIEKSEIKANEDGSKRFKCGGLMISVEPRDELVKVKAADPEAPSGEDDEA